MRESKALQNVAPREKRRLEVNLGSFAFASLGGEHGEPQVAAGNLIQAIEVYWADRDDPPPGWVFPAQIQEQDPAASVKVELALDDSLATGLEAEAARRGVSISQLATHAGLYYLARLDAEAAAERIAPSGSRAGS